MLHCLICNHRCGTAKALRVHLGTINKTRTDHRICSTDVTHTAFASFGGLRQEAEMIYSMFIVNKSGGLIFNKVRQALWVRFRKGWVLAVAWAHLSKTFAFSAGFC
jgi:hypothetical protein